MKTNTQTSLKRGFTLVELLVVIAIIAVIAGFSTPAIMGGLKRAQMTKSMNNATQMHKALFLYAMDYDGEFISDDNAGLVDDSVSTLSKASDAYGVLMKSGAISSSEESLFYTKELKVAVPTHKKGNNDGNFTEQECGYSYVKNLANTSNANAPLVTTKVKSASGEFYSEVWQHRAIIVRAGGSATITKLSGNVEDGDAQVREIDGGSAKNIFDIATEAGGELCQ